MNLSEARLPSTSRTRSGVRIERQTTNTYSATKISWTLPFRVARSRPRKRALSRPRPAAILRALVRCFGEGPRYVKRYGGCSRQKRLVVRSSRKISRRQITRSARPSDMPDWLRARLTSAGVGTTKSPSSGRSGRSHARPRISSARPKPWLSFASARRTRANGYSSTAVGTTRDAGVP